MPNKASQENSTQIQIPIIDNSLTKIEFNLDLLIKTYSSIIRIHHRGLKIICRCNKFRITKDSIKALRVLNFNKIIKCLKNKIIKIILYIQDNKLVGK